MPIIEGGNTATTRLFEGVVSRMLANTDVGATGVTVNELTLQPNSEVPPHIHPTHEEAIYILEGELEATVGDEHHRVVRAGDLVLAPQGVRHHLVNRPASPARILAIFPTTDVRRQPVD